MKCFFFKFFYNLVYQSEVLRRTSCRACLCFVPCTEEARYKAGDDSAFEKLVLTYSIRLSCSCWQGSWRFAELTSVRGCHWAQIKRMIRLHSLVHVEIGTMIPVAVKPLRKQQFSLCLYSLLCPTCCKPYVKWAGSCPGDHKVHICSSCVCIHIGILKQECMLGVWETCQYFCGIS